MAGEQIKHKSLVFSKICLTKMTITVLYIYIIHIYIYIQARGANLDGGKSGTGGANIGHAKYLENYL